MTARDQRIRTAVNRTSFMAAEGFGAERAIGEEARRVKASPEPAPWPSKHHNLSNSALADAIGRIDAIARTAEAELKALKDEFKARGLRSAIGERAEVALTERTSNRLDTAKVRAFFGPTVAKYETPVVSTTIRVWARRPTLATLIREGGYVY